MIATLEVIRIHDDLINPPGPKMVACICPDLGLFLRINTRGWRRGSLLLTLALHQSFLSWDSHIECGSPFELDDYTIDQSVYEGDGIIGRVHQSVVTAIIAEVIKSDKISANDIEAVCLCLQKCCV